MLFLVSLRDHNPDFQGLTSELFSSLFCFISDFPQLSEIPQKAPLLATKALFQFY